MPTKSDLVVRTVGRMLIVLALALSPVSNAGAQGTDRLETAVRFWLAGDDERSLALLGDLARGGHADARLLLGRIETQDMGHSAFRHALSRQEARAVFRQDDGSKFGRTWLSVEAARGNEWAQALLASRQPRPDLAVIEKLFRLGEREATDHLTRIVALYGDAEAKRKLGNNPDLLTDLIPYLDYLSGPPEPSGDGLAALRHIVPDRIAEVDARDPDTLEMASLLALGLGFGGHSAANKWRTDVETWVRTAASTRPIMNLCRQSCSREVASCGFAFLALSGGYFEAIRLDTPLEKIIPQEVFLDSARAKNMTLNRATLVRTESNSGWLSDTPELSEISQCVATLIETHRATYEAIPAR